MIMCEPAVDVDLNAYEIEDRTILARRFRTYSVAALKAALPIDNVFVADPQFMAAVNAISRVYELAGETSMQQGIYLEGPAGTGKTSALRYFIATLAHHDVSAPRYKVVGIRAKKNTSAGHLITSMLRFYGYPIRKTSSDTLDVRTNVTKEAIRHKQSKLLWIDEAAKLLYSLSRQSAAAKGDGTSATDLICELMDETRIGIALTGSERLADIERTDEALADRLTTHERLGNFDIDASWVAFVVAFFRQCVGFDFSFFEAAGRMETLHRVTRGNKRSFKRFITECGLCVADRGAKALSEADAARAYRAVFGSGAGEWCPYASTS